MTVQRQYSCLINEPGAGINYMHIFDMYPPIIREFVRECPYNICCACLGNPTFFNEDDLFERLCEVQRQIHAQEKTSPYYCDCE
jgi:hypothetical protein